MESPEIDLDEWVKLAYSNSRASEIKDLIKWKREEIRLAEVYIHTLQSILASRRRKINVP